MRRSRKPNVSVWQSEIWFWTWASWRRPFSPVPSFPSWTVTTIRSPRYVIRFRLLQRVCDPVQVITALGVWFGSSYHSGYVIRFKLSQRVCDPVQIITALGVWVGSSYHSARCVIRFKLSQRVCESVQVITAGMWSGSSYHSARCAVATDLYMASLHLVR